MELYSKTYAGIIIVLLGWFGIGSLFNQEQAGQLVDSVIQLVGIIIAAYGRYKVGDVTPLGFKK